jgi:hypothetical protein
MFETKSQRQNLVVSCSLADQPISFELQMAVVLASSVRAAVPLRALLYD